MPLRCAKDERLAVIDINNVHKDIVSVMYKVRIEYAKSRNGGNAHWDVDELNEITNKTHNRKTDNYCLAYLREFWKDL